MTLSDQAATGSADREAVAIALGWVKEDAPGDAADWFFWRLPSGKTILGNPTDYQRDLPATLAEIERRGWEYLTNSCGQGADKYSCSILTPGDKVYRAATGTIIANAACAALLKALENSDAK